MSREFIQIGNVRIKRANISSFGTSVRERVEERKGRDPNQGFWRSLLAVFVVLTPPEQYRYLYVTTYQRDNYTFTEDEIDIDATLADLEKGK